MEQISCAIERSPLLSTPFSSGQSMLREMGMHFNSTITIFAKYSAVYQATMKKLNFSITEHNSEYSKSLKQQGNAQVAWAIVGLAPVIFMAFSKNSLDRDVLRALSSQITPALGGISEKGHLGKQKALDMLIQCNMSEKQTLPSSLEEEKTTRNLVEKLLSTVQQSYSSASHPN